MKKFFGVALIFLFMFVPMVAVHGQNSSNNNTLPNSSNNNTAPTQTVSPNVQGVSVTNPLGNNVNSFCGLIKALLAGALQIGIPVAVLFIVYAGFKFVLARGNATKLEEARRNLLYTIIGIAIFLGAWLLANFVANTVNSIGGNGQSSLVSCQ